MLSYIETNVIVSKTIKIEGQAESVSFYNYPYNALEEAVVNAVFHKTYRDGEPVEIRIYIDNIVIINYPGPPSYISMDKFASGKARPRKYRNRRIGEFFKEIDLSEKAATGISKILSELKRNGSPKPEFETDEGRAYLETTIRIHDGFIASDKNGINLGVGDDLTVGMSDKMSDKMSEKMSDKTVEKTREKTVQRVVKKVAEKVVENDLVNDLVNGTVNGTVNDTVNEESGQKSGEKSRQKTGKTTQKTTQKIKSGQKSGLKNGQKNGQKSSQKGSQKSSQEIAG